MDNAAQSSMSASPIEYGTSLDRRPRTCWTVVSSNFKTAGRHPWRCRRTDRSRRAPAIVPTLGTLTATPANRSEPWRPMPSRTSNPRRFCTTRTAAGAEGWPALELGNPRPPRADQRADRSGLPERKAVCFSPSVEEFDLEGSILNAAPLADQLVEPLIIRSSLPLAVNVASVGCANSLAVDKDAKPHRSGTFWRSHDEVEVAGMKAKGDTTVRLAQNRCPPRDSPIPRERPIVQVQAAGKCIGARLVRDRTTGRGKTFRLVVAGVGLSRLEGAPFGGNFGSLRLDRHQVIAESAESRVREQLLDDHLRHVVRALAKLMGSDPSLGIREIERRPVVVVEPTPDPVVRVDRDRVVDPQCFCLPADVVDVSLKRKFRSMDADHHQALVAVFLSPGTNVGKRPQPVDAGKGPEVDKNDFPPQVGRRQRPGIEPPRCVVKRSQLTFNRQLRGPGLELADQLIVYVDRLAWRYHPGGCVPGKTNCLAFM